MYNPYNNFNPYQGIPVTNPTYPMSQRQEVVKVNGKQGAETYQMAANSSALLLDESAPIVWLAQTDGAGYKTVTPYSITPYQPEKPVDLKSLQERVEMLEAVINGKSNSAGDGDKSHDGESQTNQRFDERGAKRR